MTSRDIIGGAPLLRPLLALVAGVFLAANVPLSACFAALLLVVAVALVAVRKAVFASTGKSLLLSLLFVALGMVEVRVQDDGRPAPFPSDEAVYECRLTGDVYHRGKSWRAHVEVLRRMDSEAVGDGARALLYLADTAVHSSLKEGDCFYARTSMSLPAFNEGYRDYLLRNNVCGTGYVAPGNLCVVGHDEPSGLMSFAAQCRRAVHGWYASLGFDGDELAVLSALTIGLRDSITPYGAGGNGFTFHDYNAYDMLYVINEAIGVYYNRDEWIKLVKKAMNTDFSWARSAKDYENVYYGMLK